MPNAVRSFEAHTDYIRCVAVHPTLPYLLTSSDDMLIKLWDWDKGWACTQVSACAARAPSAFSDRPPLVLASVLYISTNRAHSLVSPLRPFTPQVFEGHSHYVMQVAFNPKDTNTFASASLDRTVKARWIIRLCCTFVAK